MVHPQARRGERGGALSARWTWSIPHFLWRRREEEINKHGRRYRGNALPARTKRGSTLHQQRESIGSLVVDSLEREFWSGLSFIVHDKNTRCLPRLAPLVLLFHRPVAGMARRRGVLFALLYFERRMCMCLPHARLPVSQGCQRPACSRQHRRWLAVVVQC